MPCPTCNQTMKLVSCKEKVYWCVRCGTLTTEDTLGNLDVDSPFLPVRVAGFLGEFEDAELLDKAISYGLQESVGMKQPEREEPKGFWKQPTEPGAKEYRPIGESPPSEQAKRPRTIYKHDCENCIYLGPFKGDNNQRYDLYWCAQNSHDGSRSFDRPTVIARYSSDGPDYVSSAVFADQNPDIAEAVMRAKLLGLPITS